MRDTVPVGVVAPVAEVSVTVTVHADPWPMATGLAQVTLVVVGWTGALTTILVVPELVM